MQAPRRNLLIHGLRRGLGGERNKGYNGTQHGLHSVRFKHIGTELYTVYSRGGRKKRYCNSESPKTKTQAETAASAVESVGPVVLGMALRQVWSQWADVLVVTGVTRDRCGVERFFKKNPEFFMPGCVCTLCTG